MKSCMTNWMNVGPRDRRENLDFAVAFYAKFERSRAAIDKDVDVVAANCATRIFGDSPAHAFNV